ncbi:MAG: HD domain-containing protein [Planctomycetes bacterium]|nr:HD domain-containing protein [Planctomycetota bacterium]
MDLVNPGLVDHHKRVAYIALSIGAEMGLSYGEQTNLLWAGLLHDSGAISLKERRGVSASTQLNPEKHARLGYLLFKDFKPFSEVATLIRYHRTPWNEGAGAEANGNGVPTGSHILHLADRVAVLLRDQKKVLYQAEGVTKEIATQSRDLFVPEIVQVFESLAAKEYFWLDATSPAIGSILERRSVSVIVELDMTQLIDLAKLFCQVIDFRSRFTSTHSSGVATTAEKLFALVGCSETEAAMMRAAGYLHDLGKLAVPLDILEKPAGLTTEEFKIMKTHPFHTYRILETIDNLHTINEWASLHHERLDGSGYPFHYRSDAITLGARIMSAADHFAAMTENRPYRPGMPASRVLQIMQEEVEARCLDPDIVSALARHSDEVNEVRVAGQTAAYAEYQELSRQFDAIC